MLATVKLFDKYEYPEGLYYSKDHLWLKKEDSKVRVGVTDFAQQIAGSILYVRLMPKGRKVEFGKAIGTMETGKWVGPLKSAVTGTIVETNENLKTRAKLLNEDPYGNGWMAIIEPTNLEEDLKKLVTNLEEFKPFLETEIAKYVKK